MAKKFKLCEAIVWEPKWYDEYVKDLRREGRKMNHPLKKGEVVYFLGEIPNVPGHCIVAKYTGEVVPMVHPEDFRKAKEEEL